MDPDPWSLVKAAQAGSMDAFGDLYSRYYSDVHGYCLRRTGSRQLAEDCASETFVRALKSVASVSFQGRDFGSWLMKIARNIIIDDAKSGWRRRTVVTSEFRESPTWSAAADRVALAALVRCELTRHLGELASDQRKCLVLRFIRGLSVAETAELMQRNAGAVRALQARAVRRLAEVVPASLAIAE